MYPYFKQSIYIIDIDFKEIQHQ